MSKLGRMSSLLASIALTCAVLTGCNADKPEYRAPFIGSWEISNMIVDGEETSPDDIAMMKALGDSVVLDLAEDGSYTLDLLGDVEQGTWEATGENAAKLNHDNREIQLSLADDVLSLTDGGDVMEFVAIESDEADEESADEEAKDESKDEAADDEGASEEEAQESDEAE